MLNVDAIKAQDLSALHPSEWAAVSAQLLAHIGEQSKHIAAQEKRIDLQSSLAHRRPQHYERSPSIAARASRSVS